MIFSGELARLLGGVLKGEALWSVNSAEASGMARPWFDVGIVTGLLNVVGFVDIAGLPARLTGGGALGFSITCTGLLSGIGGAGPVPTENGLTGSAFCRNALMRFSNAGAVPRLVDRTWVLIGESIGAGMLCPVFAALTLIDMLFGGDLGESIVTIGGACCDGVLGNIDTGLCRGGLGRLVFCTAIDCASGRALTSEGGLGLTG
jgi:hypothetical protein